MDVKQIIERSRPYTRFHWRSGNSFQLLIDAKQFIPAMLRIIEQANEYIFFEMYLFESSDVTTRVIDAIVDASKRGVKLYILLDDFGVRALNQVDRDRLKNVGIEVIYYNPLRWPHLKRYFYRDHRKLLLADGKIAMTGSAGIIIDNDPENKIQNNWRETMIEIKGPIVMDWKTLFEGVWNRSSPGHLRLPPCTNLDEPSNMHGRVIYSRPMRSGTITRSVIRHGLLAHETIWLATAYFVPSWKLRRMLIKKAKQNIDVRVLLPGPIADHPSVWHFGHRHYSRLLHAGVRIFEYQPRFMHSKVVLCDSWCSIGSSNLDRWNLPRNLEANQEVVDPLFASQVKGMLENDFKHSEEIHYLNWKNRPLTIRFKEWFWSFVAKFFEK